MPNDRVLILIMSIAVSITVLLAILGCAPGAEQPADFFECPPNNHLVACIPGTILTGCEAVGSGKTTLKRVDCQ